MKRREFVLSGAAFVGVFPARAQQQSAQSRRIGLLMPNTPEDQQGQERVAAFREGLAAHHWIEGQNVSIDYRWAAGSHDDLPRHVAELLVLKPDGHRCQHRPSDACSGQTNDNRTADICIAC